MLQTKLQQGATVGSDSNGLYAKALALKLYSPLVLPSFIAFNMNINIADNRRFKKYILSCFKTDCMLYNILVK